MGLDMYLFAKEADKEAEEEDVNVDIAYWRKHNRLHGWMENLYRDKFPDDTRDFNCVDLELTAEDLDRLEADITDKALPYTQGFFFGGDSYSYEDRDKMYEYDLDVIKKAREQMSNGMKIYYSSWW